MDRKRAFWMLLVSLLAGLGAVVLSVDRGGSLGATARPVVVAAMDLDAGSRLMPQHLTRVDWPAGSVPVGAFSDAALVADRVIRSNVQRGEPILSNRLAPVGAAGGLAAVIAEGKRAMTVRVNDVVGVAGFALPGNYVDVLVNARADAAGEARSVTRLVLEHVLVLAVAQESARDETRPRVVNAVTLELTPQEAETLDLARNVGNLSLALRNQFDRAPAGSSGATLQDLLGTRTPPPVSVRPPSPAAAPGIRAARRVDPPAEPSSTCVEVIRVGETVTQCFKNFERTAS